MKVIMLQDVYKQGVAGEIIEVADGYARNFLIPRKFAVKATAGELKRTGKIREQAAIRRASYEKMLNELARKIDGTELIFSRRAAPTGKLFGSVTTQEIADALNNATGVDINRRRISQHSLREVGTHIIPVRLGSEISPTLKIVIVNQDEFADFMAAREKAKAGDPAPVAEVKPASPPIIEEAPAIAEAVEEAVAPETE